MEDRTTTVTVSTKGQLVLPAPLRRKLGIKGGSRLQVELLQDGILLRPEKADAVTVDDCISLIPNKIGPMSIEEMDARVAAAFRRRGR